MKTPDELLRHADEVRARSSRTDTAVITGRLDAEDPAVVKARAFLDGFEAGLRAAANDTPDQIPDHVLTTLTPLPLGKSIFSVMAWQRRYKPLMVDNIWTGTCQICGANNVEVRRTGAADPQAWQMVCVDEGACVKGWVA